MPFDGFVLAAVRHELEDNIIGSRIDRVYQPTHDSIALNLRQAKDRMRLLLCAHPSFARIHLFKQPKENPVSPPSFCMVLRKHLEGGRIKKIIQPGLERIISLEIEAQNEIGQAVTKHLICEIMGKHSNIILVEVQSRKITDAIKKYSHVLSRHREVLPGRIYIPPPTQEKLDTLHMTEKDLFKSLLKRPLDDLLVKCLQSCLEGFSTTLANEIIYRTGLPAELALNECGEYELNKIWAALQEIIIPARQNSFQPTLVLNRQGKPIEFSAFDLTCFGNQLRKKGSMNDHVEQFYNHQEEDLRREKERSFLLKTVLKLSGNLSKKLEFQRKYLGQEEKIEQLRISGELIMANIHQISRGSVEVSLDNFYDIAGSKADIDLTPELGPVENAQAYFKKYAKAKRASKTAARIEEQTLKELNYLAGIETNLNMATSDQEISEIKDELNRQGYLKDTSGPRRVKTAQKTPQPLAFKLSEGFTALVGKTNRQNDYLITHMAKDNDIWLHVKDYPGAHVIIRTEKSLSETPAGVLLEAACLAAYFSKARQSKNVAIDYTLRKYVHKPPGAKPGFVTYTSQRTINVNPDEDAVFKLAENKK
ncbi:MAG: Fibronectin-binding A domain protein [Desulfotomaculum sp. 46_296]|nr:MAG: Fibronectin-binding A domain protein [Desulfotomaculum sp. 46_296]HAU31064.1 fibronectin/fibrinogen-binding protein [Desulfotomaculum sp.]